MVAPGAWGRELLALRLAQPDQRSCGAAVLVVAEALANQRYARRLLVGGPGGFAAEVLAMHRRVTGPVDVAGRLQPPWPRLVGTPPWAVARQLGARTGVRHAVRVVWPWQRARRWQEVDEALRLGRPVPLYVGSRALPRHVLLALVPEEPADRGDDRLPGPPRERPGSSIRVYDPASGRRPRIGAEQFLAGAITPGWPRPWFTVVPLPDRPVRRPRGAVRAPLTRRPGRRTPA